MMGIPNVELTTFWIIMFSIDFGWKIYLVIPVFILIEMAMFGVHTWVIMYMYIWPSLAFIVQRLKNMHSVYGWSILSCIYGLLFGLFCALPYVFIGAADGGMLNGLYSGFTYWIAGIPWDLVHGISNFILMFVLYKPVRTIMKKINGSCSN